MPARRLPFQYRECEIDAAGQRIRFLSPANPDEILNALVGERCEKDKFFPYWAEHWPAAQVFGQFLACAAIPPQHRICELGCGLGVVSSVLALRNLFVVSTDIAFDSCRFAHHNLTLNHTCPRVLSCDWRALPFKKRFDLLVASDVLYEPRWIEPVIACILNNVVAGGKAWIADPCRRGWEEFKARATEKKLCNRVIARESLNGGKTTVEVLELRTPAPRISSQSE